MANFDFAKLDQWAQKTNKNIEKVTIGTILSLTSYTIKGTPVGNPDLWVTKNSDGQYVDYVAYRGYPEGYIGGTARGNWQASINSPIMNEIARSDENGNATIAATKNAIDQAFGNVYYLTNNVPYIRRLEYEGWSTQAPSGMLRVTVARFNQTLEEELRKIK